MKTVYTWPLLMLLAVALTSGRSAANGLTTFTFQEGLNGYCETQDTHLWQAMPDYVAGNDTWVGVDGDGLPGSGCMANHALLRFDGIFGPGRIPLGAHIVSATLTINVAGNDSEAWAKAYRVLPLPDETCSWDETCTWDSCFSGNGVQEGTETAVEMEDQIGPPVHSGEHTFCVTTSLEAWSSGTVNCGWAILLDTDSNDAFRFESSEVGAEGTPPKLEVTIVSGAPIPEPLTGLGLLLGLGSGMGYIRRRLQA